MPFEKLQYELTGSIQIDRTSIRIDRTSIGSKKRLKKIAESIRIDATSIRIDVFSSNSPRLLEYPKKFLAKRIETFISVLYF